MRVALAALALMVVAVVIAARSGGAPPERPAPSEAGVRMGVNLGQGKGPGETGRLAARFVRIEFDVAAPVSELEPVVGAFADAGTQVNLLAGFAGRIPTAEEGENLASWVARFGPEGSFWDDRAGQRELAVDRIEFGNESSFPAQYTELAGVEDWAGTAFYADLAERYGRAFTGAAQGVRRVDAGVRLLAVANTPGRFRAWMDGIFRAVPDFADHVGGWSLHPYGPRWRRDADDAMAQVRAKGAPDRIPIDVTEVGIATDDGRCLSDNYGWGKCLDYAAAGRALTGQVDAMQEHWGRRLRSVDLYTTADQRAPASTDDREAYFGGLTATNGPKGAFTQAVRALLDR